MTRTLLTVATLTALALSVTPALAEPVRWIDDQGTIAEIDGELFRLDALPSSASAERDYGLSYEWSTTWVPLEMNYYAANDRAFMQVTYDELMPAEVTGSDGIHWRASAEDSTDRAADMGLEWLPDGTLAFGATRWWYTRELVSGHLFEESLNRYLHPVPEPSTLVLLAFMVAALVGFTGWRRSR